MRKHTGVVAGRWSSIAGYLSVRAGARGALAVLIVILVGALVGGGLAWSAITNQGTYVPPNWMSGFGNPYPPARGASYVDPVFGERIWRVTDALALGYEFINAEYSNGQHFNADESLLRLFGQRQQGYTVLFVETRAPFNIVRVANGLASSNPSDFYWHPTNPDLLYHVAFEDFMVYSVSSNTSTLVHHFGEYGSISGHGETQMSLDGRRIALVGHARNTYQPQHLFVYDVVTNTKVATMSIPAGFDSVRMMPSGNGIVVQGTSGARVYRIQGNQLVQTNVLFQGAGHSDIGMGPDGNEYLFYVRSTNDNYVYAGRLDTGATTMILPIGWSSGGTVVGMHVSANSSHRDGWVYVVTYADNVPGNNPAQGWQPFAAEVVRARFNGTGWERLAHMRGGGYPDPRVGTYWGSTPRGSVSHSGRFVVWNAHYNRQFTQGGIPQDYADVYLMEVGNADPNFYVLDGLGGVHAGGSATPLPPATPYFGFDAAVDIEFREAGGYYVLDSFGGVHPAGGAPAINPATAYFGFAAAADLEVRAAGGIYVLDRFGGIHRGGAAPAMTPATPYFGFDAATALELAPTGYYVLDKFGGVHRGGGAPLLNPATEYFAWDIARDLKVAPGGGIYVLDGFGGIHHGGGAPNIGGLQLGVDIAVDLELLDGGGWYMLDRNGRLRAGGGAVAPLNSTPYFGFNIARDLEIR